jgi:hypothetical protein
MIYNNSNYNKQHNTNSNYNDNNNEKNVILDYLYNKIELNDHKYNLIKNIGDIYELKNNKFYVSANSCGINSFIIFTKQGTNYYSYLVDRRSISYNKQTLKKSSVRITEIKLTVDLKMYDGTILDGILIDNDNNKLSLKGNDTKSTKMQFMVMDVFTLCGKSLITMNYKKKMYFFMNMLNELTEKNNCANDTIELHVSRPFELNQISNLFNEYININQKNYNIKGMIFYPEYSGNKIIYIFDKFDEKYKNDLNNGTMQINIKNNPDDNLHLVDNTDSKKIFKFELMNPECIDDILLNLQVIDTNISDVYKLYAIFFTNNKYIKKKIGTAYIPTYILSLKIKTYFMNKKSIIMSCKFNSNKNKWIPIDEAPIQKIDIINNEKRIKITEEE